MRSGGGNPAEPNGGGPDPGHLGLAQLGEVTAVEVDEAGGQASAGRRRAARHPPKLPAMMPPATASATASRITLALTAADRCTATVWPADAAGRKGAAGRDLVPARKPQPNDPRLNDPAFSVRAIGGAVDRPGSERRAGSEPGAAT